MLQRVLSAVIGFGLGWGAAIAWGQAQTAPSAGAPAATRPAAGPQTAPASRPTGVTMPEADRLMHERLARRMARFTVDKGVQYLLAAQEADGGWASQTGPGITALVLKALAQAPQVGPRHEAVRRGVEFMLKAQRDDGGVYAAEGLLKNYESSVVLSALAVLKDERREKQIAALQKFLKDNQWDEGEGKSVDDVFYGGAGYGENKRPDLSNTQMMLEALRDSGLGPDDPAYRKALVFIQRCQMLGETNDQPFAKGSVQGGFIYSPANGGESKAETLEVGGRTELRCYGSMTYAGFKSLLYAGVQKDDPRVQAALDWIRRHWSLDYNPNMPGARAEEGLYYYYHVFARALAAWDEPVITDAAENEHLWRNELLQQLHRRQREDGSWVNAADRWMEGHPALTTAYAVLALQAAYPADEKK